MSEMMDSEGVFRGSKIKDQRSEDQRSKIRGSEVLK